MEFSTIVEAPVDDVFDWHRRPGAIDRLMAPWMRMEVTREANSLESGFATLRLPLGLRWTATHLPLEFEDNVQFVDTLTTPVLKGLVPWTHVHHFESISPTQTRVTDRIDTRAPKRVLAQTLAYRGRQLEGDFAAHRFAYGFGMGPLTIAVTGSSGLIGTALCAFLSTGGHRVIRLVRSQRGSQSRYEEDRYWNPDAPAADLLDDVDAVVHLAGASISGRFNEAHKKAIWESRLGPTRELAKLVGTRPFVVASAVGIYGNNRGDEVLTESSERGDGFLADLVAEWESAADPARESGSRVTHVRTGIVQSPRGGVLKLLRPLFDIGAGGRLGDGRQWTPWIGIDDMVDIYLRCIVDPDLVGAVNAVAPNPVTNAEYTKVLARVMHRPALVPVPGFGPKLIFGSEAVDEFILAGQRAEPTVLSSLGHRFRHTDLESVLRHLLGKVDLKSKLS
ncbi:MAG: TIGR01777 family oxidoreductase [Microthrixaceae bacterium]|nr:TIGR01777 family oxidoreductase [Microthrixaceae bacterium]